MASETMFICVIISMAAISCVAADPPMLGGLSDVKIPLTQSDPDVMVIKGDSVQEAFTKMTGIKPKEFFVVSYATQVVRGTNYFAKIRIADDTYAHIRVYQDLPMSNKQPELSAVQTGKSLQDPIQYFDANTASAVTSTVATRQTGAASAIVISQSLVALLAFVCALMF